MTALTDKGLYNAINPAISDLPTGMLMGIDFETYSKEDLRPDLMSLAWYPDNNPENDEVAVVFDFSKMDFRRVAELLEFLPRASGLIAHNMVFELQVLQGMGMDISKLRGRVHDTMIMVHCRNTEDLLSLKAHQDKVNMKLSEWEEASQATRPEYIEYNRDDSIASLRLYHYFQPIMKEMDLYSVYNMEREIAWIVIEMKEKGVYVDRKKYDSLKKQVSVKVEQYIAELSIKAGRPVNVRSTKELSHLLYDVFQIPHNPKFDTSTGKHSTARDALSDLLSREMSDNHRDFIETLLDFKRYDKLVSVYFSDKFFQFIGEDGRIHATPQPLKTRTGRFSYRAPNLQQIPSRGEGAEMRRCFTATPGNKLICIDTSQIEYRLLAHFSGDPALIDAYHTGDDLHQATADMLGISRSAAKNINFGIIYGQGAEALAESLRITVDEARQYLTAYFNRFPGIMQFKESVINYSRMTGHIRTMSGRTRSLEAYKHYSDGSLERRAVNTLIQGSAADLIKLAMVEAHKAFSGTPVDITLQVHDELLLDSPPEMAKDAAKTIQEIMENVHKFSVPIVAEPHISTTWLEAKED